ncbi:MAG TPA: ABC transporter permease [Gemmatimonadaceae bacterium]
MRFWRSNVRADVDDEFQFHVQERIDDLVARGMDPRAAREEAIRAFGDIDNVKSTCRDIADEQETEMRRSETLGILQQDATYALRMMRANPSLTAAIVLTLALGIGATTAIFSVVDAVLLQPLPYVNADRIMLLNETLAGGRGQASTGHFTDWSENAHSFSAMSASQGRTVNITDGEPVRLSGSRATPSYFQVLYMPPQLGRYFLPNETEASRVVVISYDVWQTRFAGDSAVVGKEMTLNGEKHTIVGVTPAAFSLTTFSPRLWTPLSFTPEQRTNYGAHFLTVLGRLKPGATVEQARREIGRVTEDIRRRAPDNMKDRGFQVNVYAEILVEGLRTQLMVLLVAVTFVLLIGCGNVASLLLARATARRKEIAIRGALGGHRGRLVRQLLTESFLLALVGGVAGLLVAKLGVRFLVSMGPAFVPRLTQAGLHVDVLLFALAATLVCGVLFGLAPALRATRVNLQSELREGGRGSSGVVRDRARGALIVTEIAITLVLLVSAGLFLRSAQRLQDVPLGFDPGGVTMVRVALPQDRYQEPPAVEAAFTRIVENVRAIPGVQSAAAATRVPMWGGSIDFGVNVQGRAGGRTNQKLGHARLVTPQFIETLRIPLKRGRVLSDADMRAGAPWVLVVNETFARQVFGDEDPIGKRVSGWTKDSMPEWREIVGIVGDVRAFGQETDIPPEMYIPMTQAPFGSWNSFQRNMTIVARARPGTMIAPALRKAVAAVDPLLPLFDLQTMDEVLAQSTAQRAFNTMLLALLGLTGLILAAIGIYGVIAFFVSQRTHEIGVRVALGASTGSIIGMVVRQALVLSGVGIVVGAVAAVWATRVLGTMLFQVGARDPVAYVVSASALLVVALGASWLPARRAARVDPVRALASAG